MNEAEDAEWREALLHVLSDEILTPVTVLNGVVQTVIRRPDLPRTKGMELADSAQRASARLRRIVENILMATDLKSSRVQADRGSWSVSEVIARATHQLPPDAVQRISVESDHHPVVLDIELATRALAAAIENALEYTGDEPVDVAVHRTDEVIEIAVSDRGPGIPEEISGSAFDPFVQGHGGDERSHRGLGLGLYLMRSIMDLHGGRVDVRSLEDGSNSVVLCFPSEEA